MAAIEIRKVSKDWEHPKDDKGGIIPLFYRFDHDLENWKINRDQYKTEKDWLEEKPVNDFYMPEWSEDERTHFMLYYEEGTPVEMYKFPTIEELAKECDYLFESYEECLQWCENEVWKYINAFLQYRYLTEKPPIITIPANVSQDTVEELSKYFEEN